MCIFRCQLIFVLLLTVLSLSQIDEIIMNDFAFLILACEKMSFSKFSETDELPNIQSFNEFFCTLIFNYKNTELISY